MEKQVIHIPAIILERSDWTEWNKIKIDARANDGVAIPNGRPGVYEVRHNYSENRLHIGRASDLRMRVRQGLVKGKTSHSSSKKIRVSKIFLQ